jgi:hypothetical protein
VYCNRNYTSIPSFLASSIIKGYGDDINIVDCPSNYSAMYFVDEKVGMFKASFKKRLKGYKQMGYKLESEKQGDNGLFD